MTCSNSWARNGGGIWYTWPIERTIFPVFTSASPGMTEFRNFTRSEKKKFVWWLDFRLKDGIGFDSWNARWIKLWRSVLILVFRPQLNICVGYCICNRNCRASYRWYNLWHLDLPWQRQTTYEYHGSQVVLSASHFCTLDWPSLICISFVTFRGSDCNRVGNWRTSG